MFEKHIPKMYRNSTAENLKKNDATREIYEKIQSKLKINLNLV